MAAHLLLKQAKWIILLPRKCAEQCSPNTPDMKPDRIQHSTLSSDDKPAGLPKGSTSVKETTQGLIKKQALIKKLFHCHVSLGVDPKDTAQ